MSLADAVLSHLSFCHNGRCIGSTLQPPEARLASYVEAVLTKDEHVVHTGHISLWSLWIPILLGFVLLAAFGLGLILWGYAYIKYKTTELAVTNKRVIVKTGFVSRRTVEININKVESIQVDQSLWGRAFNFGTLLISGAGYAHAPIIGISDPMRFRKAFVEAQEAVPSRIAI